MNILHYLPSFALTSGGPIRAVLDLASTFAVRGHSVTLLTCEQGDAPPAWDGSDPLKPRVVLISQAGIVNEPIRKEHLAVMQREVAKAQVLHVHGVWNYSNVQVSRYARKADKPYIVSLRGMLDDWSMEQKALKKRLFHALVYKGVLERAAAVHCTAQAELDQSKKWFPRGNGVVIANLLDLDPFRTPPGPQLAREKFPVLVNGRPNVLFLSRIHYKKGADILIAAAARLRDDGFAANFILAGTGPEDYFAQMKTMVADLKLEDRVFFAGHVSGALKVSLYQAADVFALPTSQENFGFVFPEALASGTPVITTKGVDIWRELLRGGASSIIDRTPEAFAAEIKAILTNPDRLAKMKEAAKPFVFEEYDEKRIIGQFEAMYGRCIGK